MEKMINRQKGMTMLGLLFVLAFIAVVVLFTLRAFPLYNEKMQVVSAMNTVTSRPDATELSVKEVRDYFYRQIQVTNISRFSSDNLKDHVFVENSNKKGEPKIMHVKFDATNKLFADLHLLMVFDRSIPLRGPDRGE
jgi:Tfp pilus assembly protein PilE